MRARRRHDGRVRVTEVHVRMTGTPFTIASRTVASRTIATRIIARMTEDRA